MRVIFFISLISILLLVSLAAADTFVSDQNSQTYHGYATGIDTAGLSEVNTVEQGLIE